jgi:hypothetical protein
MAQETADSRNLEFTPESPLYEQQARGQDIQVLPYRSIGLDLNTDNIITTRRARKPNNRYEAHSANLQNYTNHSTYHMVFAASAMVNNRLHTTQLPPAPRNWREMKNHLHATGFAAATKLEWEGLQIKKTFKRIPRTAIRAHQVLPMMWVFSYKLDSEGYLLKYKARLVVRGDVQRHFAHEDFYAATLASRVFRAMVAIAAYFDLEMKQFDAVAAFLNSDLDEEIYVSYPEGYGVNNEVLRLLKALYGLRRSPLLWFNDITSKLTAMGFRRVGEAQCLFVNKDLVVFFFVDDIVVLYHKSHEQAYLEFKAKLMNTYELREMGDLQWFLAIQVIRDRSTRRIWLSQHAYIDKIVERFNLTHTTCAKTPMIMDEILAYEGKATPQEVVGYQQRVGSINYPAVITRPDIARAAQKLAEFLINPGPAHYAAADRVITYLKGTKYHSLVFGAPTTSPGVEYTPTIATETAANADIQARFTASSDASFADNPDRKSTEGFLFTLFGGSIDWKSTKQKTVTTSTTEAELLSLSHAATMLIWWLRFFSEIELELGQDATLHCDNLQTVRLMIQDAPKLITKLRHVDIHQHWLREQVGEGKIKIEWIATAEMPADGFTKSLSRQKHSNFLRQLNIVDIEHLIRKATEV